MLIGFTPAFVAFVIFLGTVFDVRLRRVLLFVAILALPALVVAVLHLLENFYASSWMPRVLS